MTTTNRVASTMTASLKLLVLSLLIALSFSGCAGDYGGAYYSPSYRSYYGDYGYNGGPYSGYDPGYYGGFAIGSSNYHRSYGSHHFSGDYHSGHSERGIHASRGPVGQPGGGGAPSAPSAPSGSRGAGGARGGRP